MGPAALKAVAASLRFMDGPFATRTAAVQERLADGAADGVVLFPSPNLYYLTGFWEAPMERHLLLFVGASGDPAMVAPTLYEAQLADETWLRDVRTYDDGADPLTVIEEIARDLDVASGHLLLDPTMWARFTLDLRETLPAASFGLADQVLGDLRLRKDETERERLRAAGRVADAVVEDLREMGEAVVGTTEAELARTIERRLQEAGADEPSFDVIVGSGPNGAKPHHHHGDRVIDAGDPVVLDFGARVDHYPSDQTRTLVFGGDPPDGFEDAFAAVRDAQEAAVQAVEPGATAGSIDQAARSVIEERGFGDAFIHRTGHGVGLDVHEEPYIVADNDRVLEPGMVFSVEPGVYVEGEYGVRIEDLVLVTEDGNERLNHTDRGYRTGEPPADAE
ncbi:MAG: M24 family metallopeptidase [Halanaeroarchaeum sp.]